MTNGFRIMSRLHNEDLAGTVQGSGDGVTLISTSHPTPLGMTHPFELQCNPLRIYLAGKMRGEPYFNCDAFDLWSAYLRSLGHTVFSPSEHTRKLYGDDIYRKNPEGDEEKAGIDGRLVFSDDIDYIINEAEAIAMMPGWRNSKGARAEHAVAVAIGLPIYYLGPRDEEYQAVVASIKGDEHDKRYITLGVGDGTFHRWSLTDSLMKKIWRDINDRL